MARELIQKSLGFNSGKVVVFVQTFGPLVSFLYYLKLVLFIVDKLSKLLNFSGKIVTSLADKFPMPKSLFKNSFGH